MSWLCRFFFFFQAEDGIRDAQESRGLGDVYKRQSTQSTGITLLAMAAMSTGTQMGDGLGHDDGRVKGAVVSHSSLLLTNQHTVSLSPAAQQAAIAKRVAAQKAARAEAAQEEAEASQRAADSALKATERDVERGEMAGIAEETAAANLRSERDHRAAEQLEARARKLGQATADHHRIQGDARRLE
eukprot:TRINITY_DN63774_c0_g1_i1.p1 TRINITY_DN63774_c0_g1~~TRINITY_DN63774_c0_g1_i1.p1  ORF type:complete len:186 (-),score=53.73 TRINITY_DN63774_c0_g1_i1:79-636(-)